MSEEKRSCENCGNARCANSLVAFHYDECVESGYTKHWRPKEYVAKIRITRPIPVAGDVKPAVNAVYGVVEIERRKKRGGKVIYFIEVGDQRVGVYDNECEVVKEAEA